MKIYLATWLTDRSLGESLNKTGGSKRLASFHFVKDSKITNEQFKEYCETGECDLRKTKT